MQYKITIILSLEEISLFLSLFAAWTSYFDMLYICVIEPVAIKKVDYMRENWSFPKVECNLPDGQKTGSHKLIVQLLKPSPTATDCTVQ